MSDTTADGVDDAEKGGKGGMIKMAGAGGIVVVLLAAGYFFLAGGSSQDTAATQDVALTVAEQAVFYELPAITVNLASSNSAKQEYLKLQVSLELLNEEMRAQIEPVMPRVLDAFQVYLRELRSEDLNGSSGMFRLKEELRKRVNSAVAPAQIEAILFTDMLVQ